MSEITAVPGPLQVVLYPVLVAVVVDVSSEKIIEATVLDSTLGVPSGPPAAVAIAEGDAWWPTWRVGGEIETPLDPITEQEIDASLAAATEQLRLVLVDASKPAEVRPIRLSLFLCNLSGSMAETAPEAARLKQLLDGQTSMNLEVIAAPMGGGLHVTVEGGAESVEDLSSMVLSLLAGELASERRVNHLEGALRALLSDPASPVALARARQALGDHAPEVPDGDLG
jgi:hypothetical protein